MYTKFTIPKIFRVLAIRGQTDDEVFNPLDSKCEDSREICCRLSEWRDIPLEEEITVPKRPPSKCIEELRANQK